MATKPRESRTLEGVRRWRKEAYEARAKMTPEQVVRHDRDVLEGLGLAHLPVSTTIVAPANATPKKKAG